LGGRIMAFKIGEKWLDIICVLRRRVAPINSVWREMSAIMRAVNRRMPDLSGMTFHLDAGYFELGMTEPQRIMRPVVLISATFTPPERSSPVWVDAMVVPVTKLSDDDDDGLGSWRNHEFC
jgi:hypothetical protein